MVESTQESTHKRKPSIEDDSVKEVIDKLDHANINKENVAGFYDDIAGGYD